MGSQKAQGGCYCGNCRFEITLPVKDVIHCHCSQCRHLSGAAFTTWVSVLKESFALVSDKSGLSRFHATKNCERSFCGECGTTIFAEDRRYPDIVGIPMGVIHGDIAEKPSVHAFFDSKAAWVDVSDGLPCLGGVSGFERLG